MDIMDLFGPITANDNDKRACLECKAPISGQQKKFCSAACGKKLRDSNRDRNAKASGRECEWCHGTFFRIVKQKDALRFCSRECGFAHKRAVIGASNKATYAIARPLCGQCGVRFNASTITTTYCSDDCRMAKARDKARLRAIANDNVDRTPRSCAECGDVFATSYGDGRTVYCSDLCSRRNARRTKRKKERARLRGVVSETVNPITVLERDGWVCQICGIDTPRDKRGTYDADAPEMDHVIPLAKGGSHTYDNVQCACRQCNAAKSDVLPMAA